MSVLSQRAYATQSEDFTAVRSYEALYGRKKKKTQGISLGDESEIWNFPSSSQA